MTEEPLSGLRQGLLWPIKGRITQGFGRPALKVEPEMWLAPDESRCRPTRFAGAIHYEDVHPGIDIACPIGTPIIAPAAGIIVRVVTYRIFVPEWGRYVNGTYGMFRFERDEKKQAILHVDHLSKIKPEGTRIAKGGTWAWTGNSGASTGPHAHLEVRVGPTTDTPQDSWGWFRVNPRRYFAAP